MSGKQRWKWCACNAWKFNQLVQIARPLLAMGYPWQSIIAAYASFLTMKGKKKKDVVASFANSGDWWGPTLQCFGDHANSESFFRSVYHCPFCNLCRLGQGLGIDFFHCMKCNCCLGMKLIEHKCREKMLEMNCPICCDFLFTSSAAVKGLPCGHFMHSACFQVQ